MKMNYKDRVSHIDDWEPIRVIPIWDRQPHTTSHPCPPLNHEELDWPIYDYTIVDRLLDSNGDIEYTIKGPGGLITVNKHRDGRISGYLHSDYIEQSTQALICAIKIVWAEDKSLSF
jgi:hypothetical protein